MDGAAGTQPPSWADAASRDGPASASSRREFGALQQHIDELTQEKFELSRRLNQQALLAQTLAAENTSLTEDFNQQVSGSAPVLVTQSAACTSC